MIRADVVELFGHDVFGQFVRVALAAQVREVKLFQIGGHDLCDGFGGGDVGDVAVAAEDALLQRPRTARTVLQHFHVVIGFEHEDVGGANAFGHELGDVAKVGGKTDVARTGAENVADGILGVVWNGKGIDADIADLKTGAVVEEPPIHFGFERGGGIGAVEGEIFFCWRTWL